MSAPVAEGGGLLSSLLRWQSAPAHASPAPTRVQLASTASEFPAGGSVTLTATVNQELDGSGTRVAIWDVTTGVEVKVCTSGTSCATDPVSFTAGPKRQYQAFVTTASQPTTRTAPLVTSSTVPVSRQRWSVRLSASAGDAAAGDSYTVTAIANQDLGATGDAYRLVIRNGSGTQVAACTTGTTCEGTVTAGTSGQTILATVENADGGDVQVTSNQARVLDRIYEVVLTSTLTTNTALTATVNQPLESGHSIELFETVSGTVVATCTTGPTCATTITGVTNLTYRARVVKGSATVSTSNDVTATVGKSWATSMVNKTVVGAGSSAMETFTVTATTNIHPQTYGYNTRLFIVDTWTGKWVTQCAAVTCTYTAPAYSNWQPTKTQHAYTAYVTWDYGYNNIPPSGWQAVSNPSGPSLRPWSLAVEQVNPLYTTTQGPTFKIWETSGQNVANVGVKAMIFDETGMYNTGVCATTSATTPCTVTGPQLGTYTYQIYSGASPHIFRAYVAVPGGVNTPTTHYAPSQVGYVGPQMRAARLPWTVAFSISGTQVTFYTNQKQSHLYNQNGFAYWPTWLIDKSSWPKPTSGNVAAKCTTGDDGTCTTTLYQGHAVQPFLAIVAADGMCVGGCTPAAIQASSDGYQAPMNTPASTAAQTAAGSDRCSQPVHADPCQPATGEFYLPATDLSLPGRLPVDLGRTYSTLRASTAGVFGYGWTSLLDVKLSAPAVGGYGNVASPVEVRHSNGAVWLFDQFYNSTFYPARPGTKATLRKTDTGWEATQVSDGMRMVFDLAGALTSMVDRYGQSVTLTRTATTVTVATEDGRELVATLDAGTGRVTTLDGPGSRQVSYSHDASGNLTAVTDPRGKTSTFGYASPTNHLMTSFATPTQAAAGVSVVNTYDSSARIKTQAIPVNPSSGQTTPQNQTYAFGYSGAYPDVTTTVTEPNNASTVFEYVSGRLARKVIDSGTIASGFTYSYDEDGNLVRTDDADGYAATAAFDTAGNQISATDSAGNVTRWTYNGLNLPTSETIVDAAGAHTTTFTYNALGLRTSMTVPVEAATEATTTFTYGDQDHPADVTEVTDPDGVTTTTGYDDAGMQVARTVSAGNQSRAEEWTYNAYGDVLTHTLPRGTCQATTGADPCDPDAVETTTYVAGSSLPASVTVPANNPGGQPRTTDFGYDDDGRVTSVTDPDGDQTTTRYWLNGLPRTITGPGGGTTTTDYTALGDIAARTTALDASTNAATIYTYDAAGRVKTVVSAEGNKPGQPAVWKTARTTTYTYSKGGRVTKVSRPDPAGGTIDTTTTYDYAGRPHQVTGPTGVRTTTSYGPDNRVATVADHDGNQTTYSYDYAGRTIEVVRPSNGAGTPAVRTTYSPGGRVLTEAVKTGASTWATTTATYTPLGEVDTVTTPGGAVTDYDYSVHGTLVTVTDPEGGQILTAHNLDGSVAASTDPLGRDTTTTHTPAGKLASVSRPASTTGVETTGYGYDDDGNLTSVTPPRTNAGETTGVWTFTYDLAGRQLTAADPLGNTRSTGYNLDGDIVTLVSAKGTGAANTTTYTRDPLGQVTAVGYGDGSPGVSFTYTKASKVASRTDTRGATTFAYNARGLLASVTRGGSAWAWTFNPDGSTATETRPSGGTETYTYDTAGRVNSTATPDGTLTYTYDTDSRLTSVAAGATTESYGYDDTGELTALTLANQSGPLASSTITRLADGAPGVVTVARAGQTETHAYAYDNTGRIAGVCYNMAGTCYPASADEQYGYDRNGNRTSATLAGTTTTWLYNAADMPTSRTAGGTSTPISVDADGNVLDDGTTTYTYRLDGKVKSATSGGVTHTYTLDGAGNRVIDTAGGTTTTMEWHPLDSTQLAYTTTGAATQTLRRSPAGPALLTQAGVTYSLGRDQVGGVTDLIDPSGALVRASDWTAYGTSRAAAGAPTPSGPTPVLGFQGMLAAGTGDGYYTPARIYDPTSGTFTGQDPEFMSAGPAWNAPAVFANNNPTRYTDPTGQNFLDWLASDDGGAPILYAIAGIGDSLTLGYTSWFRDNNPWFDTTDAIDTCSGAYTLAKTTTDVASITIGGTGLAKGATKLATRTIGRTGATAISHEVPRLSRLLADDTGTLNLTATTARQTRSAAKALTSLPKALSGGAEDTYVYFGTRSGKSVYTGITNSLKRRGAQHGARFDQLEAITDSPVTRGQAKAIEQALIARNPGFENKINSISQTHSYYDDAVSWGEAWLRRNGY